MLFKMLNSDGTSFNGGTGKWSLPHEGLPGEWMPAIKGELIACSNGYHLCRSQDLVSWLGPVIYEAEVRGEILMAADKVVTREARLLRRLKGWNATTARLFACDCAEHVLPLFEKQFPDDKRPHHTIELARRYAQGQASNIELDIAGVTAAAAAWDATAVAARNTAFSAAWAAERDTAWSVAAWLAAWVAAEAAVRDVGWAAEREWQTKRLMELLGVKA